MNLAQYLEHWGIVENPFRGEEARNDEIFARMGMNDRGESESAHSDFEKIIGVLDQPSSSIVFGEKGAGKTAIRLQIAARIGAHNREHPDHRVLMIPYDDLNAHLDHFARHGSKDKSGNPFSSMRLVDHMDALLSIATGRIVNALLPGPSDPPAADLGEDPVRTARRMNPMTRRDLLILQALYDTNDPTGARTQRLAKLLRLPSGTNAPLVTIGLWLGWIPAVALFFWVSMFAELEGVVLSVGQLASGVLLLGWVALMLKTLVLDRLVVARIAGKVSRQLRMVPRTVRARLGSIRRLPTSVLGSGELPVTDSDEQRYEMMARLRTIVSEFGFGPMVVVIDRVDEPTLVNGDTDRMRAIIWPMLNNKFLQLEGVGVKMLLPIELRHALFKESSAFFQEARLDKQNLIERLSWTGAMLYDLCNARLSACKRGGDGSITLLDMFAEDVSRQDVVEALGAMQQPRDAFKFVYRCLSEHCASVTSDDAQWRVPRHVLERVRKEESDRVMGLQRGIRPG